MRRTDICIANKEQIVYYNYLQIAKSGSVGVFVTLKELKKFLWRNISFTRQSMTEYRCISIANKMQIS